MAPLIGFNSVIRGSVQLRGVGSVAEIQKMKVYPAICMKSMNEDILSLFVLPDRQVRCDLRFLRWPNTKNEGISGDVYESKGKRLVVNVQ